MEAIPKEAELTMKAEWIESYRAVGQGTVRSQTTKDKEGALPSAVYEKLILVTSFQRVFFPDLRKKVSDYTAR